MKGRPVSTTYVLKSLILTIPYSQAATLSMVRWPPVQILYGVFGGVLMHSPLVRGRMIYQLRGIGLLLACCSYSQGLTQEFAGAFQLRGRRIERKECCCHEGNTTGEDSPRPRTGLRRRLIGARATRVLFWPSAEQRSSLHAVRLGFPPVNCESFHGIASALDVNRSRSCIGLRS